MTILIHSFLFLFLSLNQVNYGMDSKISAAKTRARQKRQFGNFGGFGGSSNFGGIVSGLSGLGGFGGSNMIGGSNGFGGQSVIGLPNGMGGPNVMVGPNNFGRPNNFGGQNNFGGGNNFGGQNNFGNQNNFGGQNKFAGKTVGSGNGFVPYSCSVNKGGGQQPFNGKNTQAHGGSASVSGAAQDDPVLDRSKRQFAPGGNPGYVCNGGPCNVNGAACPAKYTCLGTCCCLVPTLVNVTVPVWQWPFGGYAGYPYGGYQFPCLPNGFGGGGRGCNQAGGNRGYPFYPTGKK